jgi:hypothetical protein
VHRDARRLPADAQQLPVAQLGLTVDLLAVEP